MRAQEYLEEKKNIQKALLEFVNNEDEKEESFQNLINIIIDQKIQDSPHELKSLLRLVLIISDNHFRFPHFIKRIERILCFLKEKIKQTFTNSEIFQIFKDYKRILLFIFEEKFISPDKSIVDVIISQKYQKADYFIYFFTEISAFIDEEIEEMRIKEAKKLIFNDYESFKEKRKIGQNDSYICQLIRDDSIDEFISFVNLKFISLSSTIEPSIFETNSCLIKKDLTLIEYAAFFGSTQIFKYLFLNGAVFSASLWTFAIHGNNPEMISIFEENNIQLSEICYLYKEESYQKCLIEAIKCHHIDITNYILLNYSEYLTANDCDFYSQSMKYYNYLFFPKQFDEINTFYYLCKYDYFTIVKILLQTTKIDINARAITKDKHARDILKNNILMEKFK